MFDLVIENYVKEDYVTNKVYKALYAGAIYQSDFVTLYGGS